MYSVIITQYSCFYITKIQWWNFIIAGEVVKVYEHYINSETHSPVYKQWIAQYSVLTYVFYR